MNELRRMAYLEALRVDTYVSRSQLPGAATSRRLAVVGSNVVGSNDGAVQGRTPGIPDVADNPVPWDTLAAAAASSRSQPDAGAPAVPVRAQRQPQPRGETPPRFSLAAIVAGDWLWLESLGDMPLATEQVWLVKAMAQALVSCAAHSDEEGTGGQPGPVQADVAQFDWPIHTNAQLDLGEEAARASVAGFIGRKLQQHQCRGMVLLGQACQKWVPVEQMQVRNVVTLSSARILASPELKREAWRNLLPLVRHL